MLIDTHCHIQFKAYQDDREAVLGRCTEKGLVMNVIGTQQSTSQKAVELAESRDDVYATIGLHPIQTEKITVEEETTLFVARGEDFDMEFYDALVRSSNKVIAIGETGLDAFHVPKDQELSTVMDKQWGLFLKHVELAQRHDLPIVIHVRDAHEELITRLQEQKVNIRAVVHCFTGNWEQAQAYLDMGFYLGFTGVVTFPTKKTNPAAQEQLLEVVDKIPLDRILVETDAPYLAPQAYRGQRSEPWMVEEVAKFFAARRGVSEGEMREVTVQNAKTLFTKII
jgi:TatD DNase family protein